MIEFEAKVKQWGNSMGIIIPTEVVKERKLKNGQTVKVMLPQSNMRALLGLIKDKKKGDHLMQTFMKERARDRLEEQEEDRRSSLTRG